MSAVNICVGQCGNQIGEQLFSVLDKDETANKSHLFTGHDGMRRAVHVDSEPKVVRRLTKNKRIRDKNIITSKRGCGSNWALGYYGNEGTAGHLVTDTLEAVRKEVERCDHYLGTVLTHSLAGGTGSGLGSLIAEQIRDEYPLNYIIACSVAPFVTGETTLQDYNSILALSSLQRHADGVILLHNDDIMKQLLKQSAEPERASVGLSHMNNVIVNSLSGIFLPTDTLTHRSGFSLGMEPWDMLTAVCPMPEHKFINLSHASRSKLNWEGIASHMLHSIKRHDAQGILYSSLSGLLVARGDTTSTFPVYAPKVIEKIRSTCGCVAWNPYAMEYWASKRRLPSSQSVSASLTLAANSGNIIEYLERVLENAELKYLEKAYLHWYWRHGACPDDFDCAFEEMKTVLMNYKDAFR